MVSSLLTSLDVDVWALAFAAFVTLVSVALAGLSAAHVSQWDRTVDREDSSWVYGFTERTKHRIEATYPRITKALSPSKKSEVSNSNDINTSENHDLCNTKIEDCVTSRSPPRRR